MLIFPAQISPRKWGSFAAHWSIGIRARPVLLMADIASSSEGSERFRAVALLIGGRAALERAPHGVHHGVVGRGLPYELIMDFPPSRYT